MLSFLRKPDCEAIAWGDKGRYREKKQNNVSMSQGFLGVAAWTRSLVRGTVKGLYVFNHLPMAWAVLM